MERGFYIEQCFPVESEFYWEKVFELQTNLESAGLEEATKAVIE